MHPNYSMDVSALETFAVLYDQPIDLATARSLVSLTDTKKDRPISIVVAHPTTPTFQGIKVDPRLVVLVRPVSPIAGGSDVRFEAKDFRSKNSRMVDVTVATPLALDEISCEWIWDEDSRDRPCSFNQNTLSLAGKEVRVRFNHRIATPDAKLRNQVRATPTVRNLTVYNESWDSELIIRGDFEPSKTYSISIDGVSDGYGSRLDKPISFKVDKAPLAASVTMADGNLWLDPQTTKKFAITSRNVLEATLLAWPIPVNDRAAENAAFKHLHAHELPTETAPVRITVPVKVDRDKLVTTHVDLSRHLTPGQTYLATVQATGLAYGSNLEKMPRGSDAAKTIVALLHAGDERSLAVHTRATPNGTIVHVARLASGVPVAGASVRLAGDENSQAVTTDPFGLAFLPLDLRDTDHPLLDIRAADADMRLPLSNTAVTDRQMFPDLAGHEDPLSTLGRAFVLTDRGIYRPGSAVFVKATVRKADGAALRPVPNARVQMRVLGPTEDEVFKQTLTTNDMGSVSATVNLAADAKVGRHRILLETVAEKPEALAQSMIQVAEFEPPRFAVDVNARTDEKNTLRADIRARYLFGAPMDKANASWTVRRDTASFPDGPLTAAGLSFRRTPRWYDNDEKPWSRAGEGTLAADGSLAVVQALELASNLGPQKFTIEADVTDASHRHIANRANVVLHPAKRYAGLKVSGSWFGVGDQIPVDLGVIDTEGQALDGIPINAKLTRTEWTNVRRRGPGGSVEWEWTAQHVEEGRCTATSAKQPVRCTLDIRKPGSYEVTAEIDGRTGGTSYLWAYGNEGEAEPAGPEKPHVLDLNSDKPRYSPGETAKILVRNPYPEATLITTVEQGDVLSKEARRVKSGVTIVNVPLAAEHAPWIHATMTLLPIGAKGRNIADYKIGAVRLPVSMAGARIETIVRSDKREYAPGEEAEIGIDVMDSGKPESDCEVALAVVDEGVLRLTDFHPIDPATALRPGHGLSFRIRDSRTDLGDLFGRSHVAGDGGGVALSTITEARKKFVETALFRPDVRTDQNGHASVKFKLPDNLTEFRIMAVALDREGKGARTESSFTVKKPVMLVPVVPRFARVGDKFEAAAMLHNETSATLAATVRLGSRSQSVTVAAHDKARVGFAMEPSTAGTLPLVFTAQDESGKALDEVEAKLDVNEPGIEEHPRISGAFSHSREVLLDVPQSVIDRGGAISVKIGQHLWPELGARLEYLLGYPHGCVEQTTSSTLPLIAARTILPRIGLSYLSQADLDTRIRAGITRLATMRTDDGGLAYWPGGDDSNVYGTAYAIRAVILAEKIGIQAPPGMLDGMKRFLKGRMLHRDTPPEVSAAIAESLADAGSLDLSASDALYDRHTEQSIFGLSSLALALSSLPGQDDRVQSLLNEIEKGFDAEGDLVNTQRLHDFSYFGSPDRSRAQGTIALARLRRTSSALPILLGRAAQAMDNYTTQATAYSLLALSTHLETTPTTNVNVQAKLDGELMPLAKDLGFGSKEFTIPLSRVKGKKVKLLLETEGAEAVGYAIGATWQRTMTAADSPNATRGEHGPSIYRVISDPRGGAVDLSKIKAGTLLRVALYARLPALDDDRRGYVALTDRLPAGFEPVQPDLATVASAPDLESHHPFAESLRWNSSEVNHIDMHDDRVSIYFDRPWGDSVAATFLVRATTPGIFALPAAVGELMYESDGLGYSDGGEVTIQ
ncbi:MAG TPA: alpha-2-macroglobulin family protein [Polyangium sp.]|nr:alpha-2-macroglobulin family protein [Polyangium sp.]